MLSRVVWHQRIHAKGKKGNGPTVNSFPLHFVTLSLLTNFVYQERRLEFVLDLHANICVPGLWVQGNSFDSVYR